MVRLNSMSVVIVDFGLARFTDENAMLTSVPVRNKGFRRGSSSVVTMSTCSDR
jgi:hypothetical protein